tara:strand:+ start:50 stop:175 length:126 start_codon:yes stop_codon:yes gene_type:complete
MKKIFIFLFLSLFIFACGKKGDPVFKESKSEKINSKIIITI